MDERMRELERAAALGDPQARVAHLRQLVRSGVVSEERVDVARELGDPAAQAFGRVSGGWIATPVGLLDIPSHAFLVLSPREQVTLACECVTRVSDLFQAGFIGFNEFSQDGAQAARTALVVAERWVERGGTLAMEYVARSAADALQHLDREDPRRRAAQAAINTLWGAIHASNDDEPSFVVAEALEHARAARSRERGEWDRPRWLAELQWQAARMCDHLLGRANR